MGRLLAMIGLLAASVGLHATPSQYLCIVEHAAGLHYDKQTKAWGPTAFAPGAKYILRQMSNGDVAEQEKKQWGYSFKWASQQIQKADWLFSQFGETDAPPVAVCDGSSIIFICKTVLGASGVEFVAPRFEIVRNGGYVTQPSFKEIQEVQDNPNDLSFEVGKCNPF